MKQKKYDQEYVGVITKISPGNTIFVEVIKNNEPIEFKVLVGKSSVLNNKKRIIKLYIGDKVLIGFDSYDQHHAFLIRPIFN